MEAYAQFVYLTIVVGAALSVGFLLGIVFGDRDR